MIKAKRKLLKPKDYDIVMQNPPPNLRQVVYYVDEDEEIEPVKHPSEHQYTNNELATMIKNGFERVDSRIDKLETRIDRIETRIDRIETRIDQLEARLDYNNLKKLPKTNA